MADISIETKEQTKKKIGISGKKLLQGASTLALILCTLLCFVVVLQAALGQDVHILGFRLFYVLTGSMEPTLPANSLLLVHRQEDYQVGDIITYTIRDGAMQGMANTHRIVEKTENSYITQGDANPVPDVKPVTDADILGKVVLCLGAIGAIRSLLEVLRTPAGFFGVVLLPLLIIALICMREFKKALSEELKRAAMAALEAELQMEKEGLNDGATESDEKRS